MEKLKHKQTFNLSHSLYFLKVRISESLPVKFFALMLISLHTPTNLFASDWPRYISF